MAKNATPSAKAKASAKSNGGQGTSKDQAAVGSNGGTGNSSTVKSTPGLEVSSTRDGYRRGGRAWTKQVETVLLSDFTDDQIDQLWADANLTIVEVDVPLNQDAL